MKYKIVLEDNKDFVLAECNTLEIAKKYLKQMIETDKYLKDYYNWDKLPKYIILIPTRN